MEKYELNQIKKNYYIFGAGKYGRALYLYLKNKVNICGFLQNKASIDEMCEEIPVYALRNIDYNLKESVVFLAVADEAVRIIAKSVLIMRGVKENNILDCAHFIEENCMTGELFKQYCIICGNSTDEFLPMGEDAELFKKYNIIGGGKRLNAVCPHCGSLDRYRWCMYVLEYYTEIMNKPCTVLHFAPEEGITKLINTNKECKYYSADVTPNRAMLQMDLTDILFKESSFDYIILNHVLEHITDEKTAVNELKRVLKDNGLIVMSFPICQDRDTFEDATIVSEEDRLIKFGQRDHVRLYGRDYKKRLESYGLSVEVKTPEQELSLHDIDRYGFIANDIMLLCRIKN